MHNLYHGHVYGCRNLKGGLEMIIFSVTSLRGWGVNCRHDIFMLRDLTGSE